MNSTTFLLKPSVHFSVEMVIITPVFDCFLLKNDSEVSIKFFF